MQIKILDPSLYSYDDLAPATVGSAGLDLKLARDVMSVFDLYATGLGHSNDLVGTGLAVAIPEGYVGLVVPRSSSGHKHNFRLGNTIGVIDSDYRGEIKLSIGGGDYSLLKRGVTVAQLVVVPYHKVQPQVVEEFTDTTFRGEGGFGSTDKQQCDHCGGDGWEPGHSYDKDWPCGRCDGLGWGCTDPLPEQKLGVLQEFDHETAQLQYEQYALNTKNGGF